MLVCFFQAEDGIRDLTVTGVQTCALPISTSRKCSAPGTAGPAWNAASGRRIGGRGCRMSTEVREWRACKKCQQGLLIPLSDYGRDGAPITYKAWVCSNPECGVNIRIENGEISFCRAICQSFK